jgi:hypothetical protein
MVKTHTEMGRSPDEADNLQEEHRQFENTARVGYTWKSGEYRSCVVAECWTSEWEVPGSNVSRVPFCFSVSLSKTLNPRTQFFRNILKVFPLKMNESKNLPKELSNEWFRFRQNFFLGGAISVSRPW